MQPDVESPLDELLDTSNLASLRAAHTKGTRDATGMLHGTFVLRQWLDRWSGAALPDLSRDTEQWSRLWQFKLSLRSHLGEEPGSRHKDG